MTTLTGNHRVHRLYPNCKAAGSAEYTVRLRSESPDKPANLAKHPQAPYKYYSVELRPLDHNLTEVTERKADMADGSS